jgi:hypothetical protein
MFTSPERDFVVSTPGVLKPVPENNDLQSGGVPRSRFQLTAADNSYRTYFGVERLEFPKQTISGNPSLALDATRDEALSAAHGRLVTEFPINLGNAHGREIRISADEGKMLATQRMYVVGDRLYVTFAVRRPSKATEAAALRFLDSFHFPSE